MAQTILTPTQVTRKALAILHNKLKFIKTINRQYDDLLGRHRGTLGQNQNQHGEEQDKKDDLPEGLHGTCTLSG